MDDIVNSIIASKKEKFRVEIRDKQVSKHLNKNRARLLAQHPLPINSNSQLSTQPGELNEILLSLGTTTIQDEPKISQIFENFTKHILQRIQSKEELVEAIQSTFADPSRIGFLFERIFAPTTSRSHILNQISLFGNLACFSTDICYAFLTSSEYTKVLYNHMRVYNNDIDILELSYCSFFNVFSIDSELRNKVITDLSLLDFLNNQIQSCYCALESQSQQRFDIHSLLSLISRILCGNPHLECSTLKNIFQGLYRILLKAIHFSNPDEVEDQIVFCISTYLADNSEENVKEFLIEHYNFLVFFVNNIEILLFEKKAHQFEKRIELMMCALKNAASLDYSLDTDGKILYKFYTASNIIPFAERILTSNCPNRTNMYFSIATILSNIALSNPNTQLLILDNSAIVSSIIREIDNTENNSPEFCNEFLSIIINLACLSSDQTCCAFAELGLLEILAKSLQHYYSLDNKMISYILQGLDRILQIGEDYRLKIGLDNNQFSCLLFINGHARTLELLTNHSNDQISQLAGEICSYYFDLP